MSAFNASTSNAQFTTLFNANHKPEWTGWHAPSTLDKLYLKSPLTRQQVTLSTLAKFDTEGVTYLSINHRASSRRSRSRSISLPALRSADCDRHRHGGGADQNAAVHRRQIAELGAGARRPYRWDQTENEGEPHHQYRPHPQPR
jgi:hypothetical protein